MAPVSDGPAGLATDRPEEPAMTPPGTDTRDPADGDESAATAGPAGRHRRAVLGLVAIAAVFVVLASSPS